MTHNTVLTVEYLAIIYRGSAVGGCPSNEILDGRYIIYEKEGSLQTSDKVLGGGVLIAVIKEFASESTYYNQPRRRAMWGFLVWCQIEPGHL